LTRLDRYQIHTSKNPTSFGCRHIFSKWYRAGFPAQYFQWLEV
jgi:hypothetical protein